MSDNAIEVKNLKKSFLLPHQKNNSIKSKFINPFSKYDNEKQVAFKDVSFEVKKGEFFGIVGRNGSGKSTLLKCLAGVYNPDKGSIMVDGKLTPFIELGVGFNPELTGRENVFLNGALLGFSRKEVSSMYGRIVRFAELEKFMDQKLKNYSSGMQVRLAFSIAIQSKGDILLLDEVLAVGDAAFQEKCQDFFAKQKGKRTIVLVTHDMGAVEKYCNRAMFIDGGEIVKIGTSDEIALMYKDLFAREKEAKNEAKNSAAIKKTSDDIVKLEKIGIYQHDKKVKRAKALVPFTIRMKIGSDHDYEKTVLGINLLDTRNNIMLATSTRLLNPTISIKKGTTEVSFEVENIYTDGDYTVNVAVSDEINNGKLLLHIPGALTFSIQGIEVARHSLTHPKIKVSIE